MTPLPASLAAKAPEAFRTISEVAAALEVPQHVLRFWETRFSQIRPLKRAGGRRYYRPEDVDLLQGIRSLLYFDGYTIKGVQKILRQQGVRHVVEMGKRATPPEGGGSLAAGADEPQHARAVIARVRNAHPDALMQQHESTHVLTERGRDRLEMLLRDMLAMQERIKSVRERLAL